MQDLSDIIKKISTAKKLLLENLIDSQAYASTIWQCSNELSVEHEALRRALMSVDAELDSIQFTREPEDLADAAKIIAIALESEIANYVKNL